MIRFWGQKVNGQGHAKPNMAKTLLGPFSYHETFNGNNLNWCGRAVGGDAILGKMRSAGQGHEKTKYGEKDRVTHIDGLP